MSRRGILGGSFNPIHNAHLLIAQEAAEQLKLDEVMFVPNKIPPHKLQETNTPSPDARFKLVQIAIADNPLFTASDIELMREGRSYSVDTVAELAKTGDDWVFITGIDSFTNYTWERFPELLSYLNCFAVFSRPGVDRKAFLKKRATFAESEKILALSLPLLQISSTDIRARLKAARSVRYMMPDAAIQFIQKTGLYTK